MTAVTAATRKSMRRDDNSLGAQVGLAFGELGCDGVEGRDTKKDEVDWAEGQEEMFHIDEGSED
jgi:hypothetical protein